MSFTDSYRKYVLGILLVVYVFNFIDRQILAILLQPIKMDLDLNDTQLGLLSGVAFAIFYATLGIPIARLADRSSRVNIISASLAVWSLMTAVCGLAQNFWQLLAARIGVGIGEAGCSPPSHSLISDYFAPETRATAMSIYSLGIPIGIMIGFLAGGWIVELFDWRTAFIVVGLPGVILAVVVKMTVIEPPRGHSEAIAHDSTQAGLMEVCRYLWRLKSFRHLAIGAALHGFVGYGVIGWLPSFLARSHQMGSAEIGTWLAFVYGIGTGVGVFAGGYLCDRFGQNDRRWYVWIPAVTVLITVPFYFFVFIPEGKYLAMLMYIPTTFFSAFYLGPTFAIAQGLAQVRMRAIASAILLFILNLIAMGLGPLAVGVLSDLLVPVFAAESLRYALLGVILVNLCGRDCIIISPPGPCAMIMLQTRTGNQRRR